LIELATLEFDGFEGVFGPISESSLFVNSCQVLIV